MSLGVSRSAGIGLLAICFWPVSLCAEGTKDKTKKDANEPVNALIKGLKSRRPMERLKAAEKLAELGEKAQDASRALCQALLDANRQVRLAAAEALEKVNPTIYKVAVPIIVDANPQNRLEAVRKVGKLKTDGNPAVPLVLHFMDTDGRRTFYAKSGVPGATSGSTIAVQVLATIAPGEKTVTKQMARWVLKDRDPTVREAAAQAIPGMEGGNAEVNTLAVALRTDRAVIVRVAAARALGELGGKEAISALALALKKDRSDLVRLAAVEALGKSKKNIKEAKKILTSAKYDPAEKVREAAERALDQIDEDK